jgi:hypothetical protein
LQIHKNYTFADNTAAGTMSIGLHRTSHSWPKMCMTSSRLRNCSPDIGCNFFCNWQSCNSQIGRCNIQRTPNLSKQHPNLGIRMELASVVLALAALALEELALAALALAALASEELASVALALARMLARMLAMTLV